MSLNLKSVFTQASPRLGALARLLELFNKTANQGASHNFVWPQVKNGETTTSQNKVDNPEADITQGGKCFFLWNLRVRLDSGPVNYLQKNL